MVAIIEQKVILPINDPTGPFVYFRMISIPPAETLATVIDLSSSSSLRAT